MRSTWAFPVSLFLSLVFGLAQLSCDGGEAPVMRDSAVKTDTRDRSFQVGDVSSISDSDGLDGGKAGDAQSTTCSTPGDKRACTTSLLGLCEQGSQLCGTDGLWASCEPYISPGMIQEDCQNGKDDDCDGQTDQADDNCSQSSCTGPDGSTILHGQSKSYYLTGVHQDCSSIVEQRMCLNGQLSGSYTNATCSAGAAPCGSSPSGTNETRIRYQSSSVPHGQVCQDETQTRSCADGVWSGWSGTYTELTCTVSGAASCGSSPSGTVETRTMYQSSSVPYDQVCQDETQTHICTDGVWSDWSGTYTELSCTVEAAPCGSSPSGTVETRTMYQSSSVPYGEVCQDEPQARTCTDGVWSDWSGTYTEQSCTVSGAASCGSSPSGTVETRTMYQSSSVPYGEVCQDETQTRSCTDGVWSDWSGTYTEASCTVEPATYLATVSGETLDCTAADQAAGWYKLRGRCGEPAGLTYWRGAIISLGVAAAYTAFNDSFDSFCGALSDDVCNDQLLCNAGDDYQRNTTLCAVQ